MMGFLQGSAVFHQILHHLPVHKRLPAEEVHLQVHTVPGILHQEVQGLLSHLKAHQGAPAMVFSLPRKAVPAGQVAVVGDMEAQRLHHGLSLFEIIYIILIDIRSEKLSGLL